MGLGGGCGRKEVDQYERTASGGDALSFVYK